MQFLLYAGVTLIRFAKAIRRPGGELIRFSALRALNFAVRRCLGRLCGAQQGGAGYGVQDTDAHLRTELKFAKYGYSKFSSSVFSNFSCETQRNAPF